MRPQGDATWTVGLIPMIEPEVVTEIISNISDLALIISTRRSRWKRIMKRNANTTPASAC